MDCWGKRVGEIVVRGLECLIRSGISIASSSSVRCRGVRVLHGWPGCLGDGDHRHLEFDKRYRGIVYMPAMIDREERYS